MQYSNISALMGFALQGWSGILAGFALCILVVIIGVALFILRVSHRAKSGVKSRLDSIDERLRPLSEEQLLEIDSQFALVELKRRGVDVRPTKDQLFGMLTSGNPNICAHAMANLQVFYPELIIPDGASNQDSGEMEVSG